jgi:tape measure domain-containing protein
MADSLGTAVLRLTADDSALRAGLNRAQQQATQAGASIRGALAGGGAGITPVPAGIFGAINRDLDNFRTRAAGVRTAWADLTSSFSGTAALIGAIGLGAAAVSLAQIGQRSQQSAIQINALAGAYGETGLAAESIARIQGVLGISALDATEGYSKLYGALRGTGLSAAQLEVIMVGTQTAARLSGASAADSAAAFLQLKQGLSSGRLAGDELRSVLENMPILAQAIAAQMGVPVGALKELGAQGKITTDIIYKAIADFAGKPAPPLTAADQIKTAFTNLQVEIAKALGPAAITVATSLGDAFAALSAYITINKDAINAFAQGVIAAAPGLLNMAEAIGSVVVAYQAFSIAAKLAAVAQAAMLALQGPAGWATLAVGIGIAGAAYLGLSAAGRKAAQEIAVAKLAAEQNANKQKAGFAQTLKNTPAPAAPAAGPSAEDLAKIADARLKAEGATASAREKYALTFQTGLLEGLALERAKQRLAIEEKQAELKRAGAAYDQALIAAGFKQDDPKVIQARATLDAAGINLQTVMLAGADAIAKASREAAKNIRDAYQGLFDARQAAFDILPDRRQEELITRAEKRIDAQVKAGEVSLSKVVEELPGAFVDAFGKLNADNADPQKLFDLAGKAQGIQEATNKVNEAVAAATTDLASKVQALLEKSWQVNLSVAGTKVEATGDVLGGVA